jgi:hypothetical protein
MPNWCENELYIRGPQIDKVLASITNSNGEFDLNKIVRNIADWFPFKRVDYWYHWRIRYWGVKWGLFKCFTKYTQCKKSVCLSFLSPWAPPEAIIPRLSARFPKNTFKLKYWEGGNGFKGYLTMKNGIVLHENYHGTRGG